MNDPENSALQSHCCESVRLVPAPRNAKVIALGIVSVLALTNDLCLNCGSTCDAFGNRTVIARDELNEWRRRWERRYAAQRAVSAAVPISTAETAVTFPDPFWLPTMGFCEPLSTAVTAPMSTDRNVQRIALRSLFGSNVIEDPVSLVSPIGNVIVDKLYFDHLYEVDTKSGKDRIDVDHVGYASLISRTVAQPIEIYLQQSGGNKTRKTIMLALYQMDSAFVYHVVILTRHLRLLTAFRLNGGRTSFERYRFGVPLYTRY